MNTFERRKLMSILLCRVFAGGFPEELVIDVIDFLYRFTVTGHLDM